jgi:hypothetical protein
MHDPELRALAGCRRPGLFFCQERGPRWALHRDNVQNLSHFQNCRLPLD